ncbi:TPM domain-containing protein [Methylocystis sp. ATCC 49242]|uniref:TPM domain-containing protein n=1 Tax=Methylocystis sp. ATCC 49242 TaxID=622637 RepID=UPI0001F86EE3|nr:TPM domain-containing protein [Methylocystis sp. ATCC 49242]
MQFTTADYERIAEAIREAEKETSGEIVCALARRSSDYAYAPPLWAAFIALVAPWPMAVFTDLSTKTIYAAQIAIFIFSAAIISWPPLRFALTPRLVKRTRAQRAAIEQFHLLGVAGTKGRTGVLIFVSFAEHYARIVADDGLAGKISNEEWQSALDPLLACMREGRCADGFVAAIRECARLLARCAPPGAGENELPDKIHVM